MRAEARGGSEGLKVPQKQPKRGRPWLNDGSCVRLRAGGPNHVWSYDIVEGRTHDGRKFRMLCLIAEFTREALALRVKRKLNSTDVLERTTNVAFDDGEKHLYVTVLKKGKDPNGVGSIVRVDNSPMPFERFSARTRRRLSP